MTRREAAKNAGVSERHLAQLELGEGNISILLLRRISAALGSPLATLLALETPASAGRQRDRIALVGLRGAGKTTLGLLLAAALKMQFIELDREIEDSTRMALGEIFSLYGQPGYRRVERKALDSVLGGLNRTGKRAILAVAGGIVLEADAFDQVLANCFTIWIKARPEDHMSRVIAQGDLRPMGASPGRIKEAASEAMAELRHILQSREAQYRRAHATLDTSGETVKQSFTKLRRLIEAEKQED